MALTWTLKLNDDMSGPAGKAAGGLRRVADGMGAVTRGDRGLVSGQNAVASALNKTAAAANRAGAALARVNGRGTGGVGGINTGHAPAQRGALKPPKMQSMGGDSLLEEILSGAGIMSAVASVFGGIAGKIGGMIASLLGQGLNFAWGQLLNIGQLQEFKNGTIFALEKVLKTKEAANAAYSKAAATSQKLGADFRESMSATQALIAQGFKADFADQIIRAMADLKAINPVANMEGIIRAISQIKTTGRLQGDELMQLAEAGVNVEEVYKKIAKAMNLVEKKGKNGKVMEQVRALQEAGKIDSATAIGAIMSSIKDQVGGGDFGEVAAQKASGSITGLIGKMMNLKDQMLSSINIDWSPVSRAVERLMAAMQSHEGVRVMNLIGEGVSKLLGALDTVGSDQLSGLLTSIGNAMEKVMGAFEGLDGQDTAKAFDMMGRGIEGAADLFVALAQLAIALGPAFALAGEGAIIFVRGLTRMAAMATSAIAVAQGIAGAIGALPGIFASAAAAVWGFMTSIVDGWVDRTSSIQNLATGLGGDIIDGIVSGIESGASAVFAAVSAVATGAIESAAGVLGIASPSRAFSDMYRQTGRGAVIGIQAENDNMMRASARQASAVAEAGTPPEVARAAQFSGAHNAGSMMRQSMVSNTSSQTKVIDIGGLTVHSKAEDPKAVANETVNALQSLAAANG